MLRGLSRLLYERALRPDDDDAEKFRKRITAEVLPALLFVGSVVIVWLLRFSPDDPPARVCGMLSFGAIFYMLLAYMVCARRMSLLVVEVTNLTLAGVLILLDWAMRAVPDNLRAWPYIILSMDFLLAVNARRWVQVAILGAVTTWLAVFHTEYAYRWGLLDTGFVQPSDAQIADHVGCADPPCAHGPVRSSVSYVTTLSVLYVDYLATRGFAEGQRRQLEVVGAAVHVSERVAALLAAYATDDARRVVVNEGAALPEPLRDAFEQLLDNLDSYRVFLPDSILYAQKRQQQQFDGDPGDDQLGAAAAARPAPGQGRCTADVAVCFTDIQGSTELWEAFPQGMFEGLEVHNRVMRRAYAACGGYEVKTIGDSFMVAFDTAPAAVRFGLTAQQELLHQHWPEDLLTHPLCRPVQPPDGPQLWGGLRVRVGLHYGEVRVERNPVTGRCDYFGATVNIAARLEAALRVGGSVVIDNTVVLMITDQLADLGGPVLHELGHRELRGVREMVHVWVVLPRGLMRRLPFVVDSFSTEIKPSPAPNFSARVPSRMSNLALSRGTPSRGTSLQESWTSSQSRTSTPTTQAQTSSFADSCWASLGNGPDASRASPLAPRSAPQSVKKLSLKMQASGATCAVARLSLAEMSHLHHCHPRVVAAAVLAVDKTNGVVETVMSACITSTWNASKPCADHVAACRQFLASSFAPECHLGAASGRVLSGSISAGRRSFTSVIGGAVEFASALAEEAAICGDRALAAGAVAEHLEAAGLAHWAQLWASPGSAGVTVMDVTFRDDEEEEDIKWALTESPRVDGGWRGNIAGLFHKACAGGPGSEAQLEVLSELQRDRPSPTLRDGALSPHQALADRIERGLVRTRHMPALWQPAEAVSLVPSEYLVLDASGVGLGTSLNNSRPEHHPAAFEAY